ncbi:MAG: phytanoyl-CoA dioxygenase [Deltaproteobacteria bacterium]|nr:phytanoyl-CoA dioxygenase [Deltaproteobacteria bacterium]
MPAADHRLTTLEVARFVVDGYLRFDALVPDALNRRVLPELAQLATTKLPQAIGLPPSEDAVARPPSLTPLSQCYPAPSALGEVLRLPAVRGIIESLVGADPLFDHDFVHMLPPRMPHWQHLHVDAILDTPDPTFDIQLFYFPDAVGAGEGGTRFVPGTHLRRVRAEDVSRYRHVLGDERFVGPAGTILIFHHGMWHAGEANPSDKTRWMYKIRLNPRVPQVRLWNTDDFTAHHNDAADHRFATMRFDSVAQVLRKEQKWQLGHEVRYDLVQRVRLWRYLSGDDRFDADYYLTRLEQRATLAESSTPRAQS